MEDQDLRERIHKLVHEEHELFRQEAQGAATYAQRERMREIEEYLDQCWDLLRQRRAKRTAGLDPEAANVRDVETVEHYAQWGANSVRLVVDMYGASILLAVDHTETESDDETAQWLKHGYVSEVKAPRKKATKKK